MNNLFLIRYQLFKFGEFYGERLALWSWGCRTDLWQVCRNVTAGKDTVQRVVVLSTNGLIFVIVATGARNRKSHQSASYKIDTVIDNVIDIAQKCSSNGKKSKGREIRLFNFRFDGVSGNLKRDKPVVRQVFSK